jgi:DNA-binding CsgD family transcriptional regulator
MEQDGLARVTEGQRACLRMVLQHRSSKEIARELGISSHTVDQRLKQAMKHLGASSRVEAAKRLAALEGSVGYQPLACQAPDIEPVAVPTPTPPASGSEREASDDEGLRRIGWIVAIAAGAAVLLAALLIGLNALSEFTR